MNIKPPENKIKATHWAVLPDDTIVFYKLTDEVMVWLPMTEAWLATALAPYTLYSFDDYE